MMLYMLLQQVTLLLYLQLPGAIASIADQLMDAGATSVLIMNLPNIGFTPRQNWDPVASAQGNFISNSVQYRTCRLC